MIMKKDINIWYVDSGKSVSGNGLSTDAAFITLQEAVTAAGDYDTIYIVGNSIETIAATGIAITQDGLRIIGANGSQGRQAAALKCTGTASMFVVTGNRFEIAGLNLSQRGAYTCIQIGSATVGAVYNTWIHHCNFDGYSTATYGVAGYSGTTDTVNLTIEDCVFQSFATACFRAYGTRDYYRRNTLQVNVDTIGIDCLQTDGHHGGGVIADNIIYGIANSSTTGIKLAGNCNAGTIVIANNLLSGTFDTSITESSGDNAVQNFLGSTTGGSVIDSNSSS